MSGGPARLADVARAAGVGTSIASRVLNEDVTVSVRPETRQRILDAARALDYRPNAFARGLKLARTMSIGLVINLAYYAEVADIMSGTERRAAASGFVTLIVDANEFAERGAAYGRVLLERRVDGLVIASALPGEDFLRSLALQGHPFVVVNRRVTGVEPCVVADDTRATLMAVDYLTALGHERIAYIAGPLTADIVCRQLDGFRAGMEAVGRAVAPELVVESTLAEGSGLLAMERLLALKPPPTAVVIWGPVAAVGALAAARRGGLELPRELSVVAINDAGIAAFLDPPLTTVRMPLRELAETGVDYLLRILDGARPRNAVVRTPPVLVERGSTCAPARA